MMYTKTVSIALRLLPIIGFIGLLSLPSITYSSETASKNDDFIEAKNASDNRKQDAINIAKAQLSKQLNLDASTFKVISTTLHTWPDSSLGCRRPGKMAAQVVTTGYIVIIATNVGIHHVHATDKYAVICDRNIPLRNPRSVGLPLKNLDDMIAKARADLAEKLHTQPTLIHTLSFVNTEWPNTSMACAIEGEIVEQKATKGYRIAFSFSGRTYVYHTDMIRVRACPDIETR